MPTFKLSFARKGLPILALMTAGLLASPVLAANTDPDEALRPAQSLEGNFLSAYVAGSARDTEAASLFFREAIQDDSGNPELLERGFVAFLANGSMQEAYRAAERLSARDSSNNLAQFALAVRALKAQKYADARARLSKGARSRQADLTATLLTAWTYAGAKDGKQAKIALLDLNPNGVTVDVQRDQGFLEGFGVDVADETKIGDESDPRIVGHDVTDGEPEGGRTAMENLLQKDPAINLVYTINEPAAAGAYEALKAAGKEGDVTIVSVDGGCPGVQAVKAGQIGATSQQYPLKMAQLGVEAIAKFAEDGTKPENTEGKDFVDTGVTLVTDQPQDGVESEDTAFGLENCWG